MNRKVLYPLLIILVTAGLYYAEKYVDTQNEAYPDTESITGDFSTSEFDDRFLPTSTTGAVVKHSFYALSYAEAHEQAEWVAYALNKNQLSKNDVKRPYFVEDRSVKTKSADWRNYKKSGYDRGHLCPAGDRRFNEEAYHETFLTSNISPQNHEFNAGVWNYLEQKVRFWADKYNDVYVVTGGVLKSGLETIGDERVSVPEEFYKIVLDASNGNYKAVAFLIPNKPTSNSFYDYVVSIDEIESKTGIDFFTNLSEAVETKLESEVNLKAWGKR
ncbi:DNA/RNA non-specific endonuclease [Ulvibacter litoralis]|uniref:Endonuclease n=1 Tax=Ulvibacter litoralis TaxID=227084 RepID=A0A1G7CFX5_9FLAO|nr:DNA/RNA non-specific endonuclease [Ulvibacter litoralis]GHC47710.1 endonuclease [Ulvibacter litoralis]SDE37596.1 endonuclease G [Ulvibacter litoralis]